jgi:nitric oxide reductase NorQ protein
MKFVIDPVKDSMIRKLVSAGKNVMLTGATGAGKTTYCYKLAESLDKDCVVVNCGSTQDARTSLLGFFELDNGNTKFTPSDFVKAIQNPNTLVVLDELSRASDDAFNILFPVLDHRRELRIEEQDGSERIVKVAEGVRFIATANIGMEYSATRSLDRALQDRFMTFNLPYITGEQLIDYIKEEYTLPEAGMSDMKQIASIYDYSHNLFGKGKIGTRISTRAVIDVIPLVGGEDFSLADVLNHAILSQYEQDSSTIVNDANILREFADSLGISFFKNA